MLLIMSSLFSAIAAEAQTMPVDGRFELMELPYAENALEPVISAETIGLHHGKHLLGYVTALNRLIAGTDLADRSLEEIVAASDDAVFNNAGQTLNHNLYFTQFSPDGGGEPRGALRKAIDASWGSFDRFKKDFVDAGTSLFGSGWVWLSADKSGDLTIVKEPNGGNPVARGLVPLLGFDVWEHAYYLDYNNRRADHLNALWRIVDWNTVEKRYDNLNQ